VALLRQIEVEIANGKSTPQACKEAEITIQTHYRWRKEFGGLKLDQATDEGAGAREREVEAFSSGTVSAEADLEGRGLGKLLSPERRRCAVEHVREKYEVSERHACRLLGQWRRTQRYAAIQRIDEDALTEAIIALASEYGRYGYQKPKD
jgi:putative transposase